MKVTAILLIFIIIFAILYILWSAFGLETYIKLKDLRYESKFGKNKILKNIINDSIKRIYTLEYNEFRTIDPTYLKYIYNIENLEVNIDIDVHVYSYNIFCLIAAMKLNDGDETISKPIWFWTKDYWKLRKVHSKMYEIKRKKIIDRDLSEFPQSVKTKILFKKI